ncbi:hypothetical protein [Sphingomonas morindae]|nr:hypothetical protein [Sphingomonas morindae]
MFAKFTSLRDTAVSAAASLLFSGLLVAAAVVPAQTAMAATFGL